jgi:micrococcal nuclease
MKVSLPLGGTRAGGSLAALVLALGVALLSPLHLATAATPPSLLTKVTRVSTGDSFLAVAETGTPLRIHLLGVDAPEVPEGQQPGQPFGEAARAHLSRLIGGRTVRVVPYRRTGPDHLLAIVFLGPTNVNVDMVGQGLAKVDRGVGRPAYYRDLRVAELKARRDRVGLWGERARCEVPAACQ